MENWEIGEYEFILWEDNSITLRIQFKIDGNGEILYYQPTLE